MPDQTPRAQLAEIIKNETGMTYTSKVAADRIVSEGWRPPARVIETPENEGDYTAAIAALDALPRGTLIQLRNEACQSIGGWWEVIGSDRLLSSEQLVDVADGTPVTVLHTPENGDPQ